MILYLKKNKLCVQLLGRGYAWLDTGTMDSLVEASNYVQITSKRQNIVISAPELTLSDAWEAAKIAAIDEDIKRMPMGMQTLISEGQGGFSGGQKQRRMIARAVAPRPKILMFDEATSALDNVTQKKVAEAIDSLGCTRIVIAHRLSTIKHCDRIIVLDHGNIVEQGTYDELIEQGGMFCDLVARQRIDIDGGEDK